MSDSMSNVAASANTAIAGEAPIINNPPNNTVHLIRGAFNDATGDWETVAEVRELTGDDEEALAAISAKEDLSYTEYLSHLLSRAVVKVGSRNVDTNPNVLDDLLIGDRDLLFLGVVKSTYGRTREVQMTCGNCGESNDVSIDLENDFKIDGSTTDLTKPISVKLKDDSVVSFNYPTAGDSRYASKKGKTGAEQNTYIIARCLVSSMLRDEREAWAKKLGIADRKKVIKALTAVQPGPQMGEVKTQCAHCDQELYVVLDWVSLLFG